MSWQERRVGWQDSSVAGEYDARRFRTRMQRRKHANDARIVRRLLARVGEGLRVLDAPVGTGRMLPDLERAGHRCVGVDLSQAMLAAIPHPGVARVAGEIERLPFANDTFDAAISLRFLFHVPDAEVRARILGEFARTCTWLVGHERASASFKTRSRRLRKRLGGKDRTRPMPSQGELANELERSGWTLEQWVPVSRMFSDKAFFLARRK